MYVFISVIILIIAVVLILVVLVQNSKGGGLASNFSSSNQFMGVRKTADFLEKTTWTLAIALLVLSLSSVFMINKGSQDAIKKSGIEEYIENNPNAAVDYQPAQENPVQTQPEGK